jgi:hypothetical protein
MIPNLDADCDPDTDPDREALPLFLPQRLNSCESCGTAGTAVLWSLYIPARDKSAKGVGPVSNRTVRLKTGPTLRPRFAEMSQSLQNSLHSGWWHGRDGRALESVHSCKRQKRQRRSSQPDCPVKNRTYTASPVRRNVSVFAQFPAQRMVARPGRPCSGVCTFLQETKAPKA